MRLPFLFITASAIVGAAGCAGTQFARQNNAQRIPSDGTGGGPAPEGMPLQMMAEDEWASAPKQKLAPTCDARPGGKNDQPAVDAANKTIGAWAAALKLKPRPKPTGVTVGQVVGLKSDPTRNVDSVALNCAAGGPSALVINGTSHAFDQAWAVAKNVGGREEVSIQALSLADKKVVFVFLGIPKDHPKNSTDEIAIVSNVGAYMPPDADPPIVRNISPNTVSPTFETLVFGKGKTEGFYYYVPRSADLAFGRFMEVGRFKVGNPS